MMRKEDFSVLYWGVAGAGKISTDFFVAVASRSIEAAKKFSILHQIGLSYGSYELLAQDNAVQIVYIGNLNTDHFETAKLFLDHGKHVLMEKPLTMNAKQTIELTSYAKNKGLFLMEALWSRFLPAYEFVMEQIKSGTIGRPLSVDASFGEAGLDQVDRLVKKKLGGGTILDLGVYAINIIQMTFDNEFPLKIGAVGHLNEDGVDLSVAASLKYSNGRSGTLRTHSQVNMPNEAVIVGTDGIIKLERMFHCADTVHVNGVRHEFPLGPNTKLMNFFNSRGLRFEADAVRQALINGQCEHETMKHEHSVTIARIEDEIRRQIGVRFDVD
ncbi:hypothetical protein RDWZM_002724 [Blomia tropicalis]|uniref:Trans-1,2-dihydrobenzene-1,2-diol dehydrogenase n=1 Tax=Blomia tropicalis TaxID=40697 RepID=A0A9Q0MEP2_BLOTA|nr:hypothetical protein RDWZM_002724 [Blomia tropicalis]